MARQYDCLLGGLELTQDFGGMDGAVVDEDGRCGVYHRQTPAMLTSHAIPRNKENGMLHETSLEYLTCIMKLDALMIIWHPAREEYDARFKNQLIARLDKIAEIDGTARPATFVLEERPKIPISPRHGKDFIMKREVSDCSRHFIGPTAVKRLTRSEVDDMRKPELPWRWLVQEYVPYLRSVGEWRLVLLNGKVNHACATTPVSGETCPGSDATTHCQVAQQWSLKEMR